jgi:hypothetical protein
MIASEIADYVDVIQRVNPSKTEGRCEKRSPLCSFFIGNACRGGAHPNHEMRQREERKVKKESVRARECLNGDKENADCFRNSGLC